MYNVIQNYRKMLKKVVDNTTYHTLTQFEWRILTILFVLAALFTFIVMRGY